MQPFLQLKKKNFMVQKSLQYIEPLSMFSEAAT